MTNTFCDKTGEGLFALHMEQHELALIADLLNSTNDSRAVKLRQAVNDMVRRQKDFKLTIERMIWSCDHCAQTGSIKIHDEFSQDYKKETCTECRGEGRIVVVETRRFEPLTPYWKEELTPLL